MSPNTLLNKLRELIDMVDTDGDLTLTGQMQLVAYWNNLDALMKNPYAPRPTDWEDWSDKK